MNRFVLNLLTEWRKLKLPIAAATVAAAISGGADSVSLLLALNELKRRGKLNLRFVAAHFNHNLRGGDSDRDEEFVKNLANRLDFELALGRGEISGEKGNLEQNARDARYQFLFETAERLDACAVLTAHTLNDQAETFLHNLMRGSGLEGLGGMKPRRSLERKVKGGEPDEKSAVRNPKSEIELIRPLLNWAKREDTENFCHLNEVEFRYDAMNEDLAFNRVRIRRILIPMLKDFNPKIVETLAKTAEMLREDALILEEKTKQKSGEAKEPATSNQKPKTENRKPKTKNQTENLSLKDLREVFPSMRRVVLRGWLKENRGNLRRLELKHIEAIEKLVFSRKSGRLIELPGGESVLKEKGKLVFQKTKVEKT